MGNHAAIAVLGTFDTKAEEHLFLKQCIEQRGFRTVTIHVGTGSPSPVRVDLDLFATVSGENQPVPDSRDRMIRAMLRQAIPRVKQLVDDGSIHGIISAGGGTGTHICTAVMRELPLGVPKVMVSTVASRDMRDIVSTKDITMGHSVADLLGVNTISGRILDRAAGAVCGMIHSPWRPVGVKKRVALSFFGFITAGAEAARGCLEELGYEVIAFHANGTGGMAMEELAGAGYFEGILDLATHELADHLMDGYCRGIGPQRYGPVPGRSVPRLVVPGGLDCAVLEFTRKTIPEQYKDRKLFFYDFRSAIRLNEDETSILADRLAERLNRGPRETGVLIPLQGWSEADREGGPLNDPDVSSVLIGRLRQVLDPRIEIREVDLHINDAAFARAAAKLMDEMIGKHQ